MKPVYRTLVALILVMAAAFSTKAAEPSSIDPFYSALAEDGIQALQEGNARVAAQTLRIACFGMLDEPAQLGRCLAYLGAAQARDEDREGFVETYHRLATVEQRFSGYSSANLPAELRRTLERSLVRWIPEEQLASVPAFGPLASRRIVAKTDRLPARERRTELQGLLAKEPENPYFRLALAQLELDEGKQAEALRQVEALLARQPGFADALCVKGLAEYQQKGVCAKAVVDLAGCPAISGDETLAEAMLDCRLELGQRREAADFYASLPADVRSAKSVARLGRQLEKAPATNEKPAEAPAPPPAPAKAAATPTPTPPARSTPAAAPPAATGPAATAPQPADLSSEDRAQLARARELLKGIHQASDIAEPLRLAADVAERRPSSVEAQLLAGEIAYRASRWSDAAKYFRRAGDPGGDRPEVLFYMAVSYYEVGEKQLARSAFERCLPRLERTPFVEEYRQKILGPGAKAP
ncbi:MAG: hypothetical protein U0002_00685 [Thermoanaerobaculia bacterium]